jgi:hypothetical protein
VIRHDRPGAEWDAFRIRPPSRDVLAPERRAETRGQVIVGLADFLERDCHELRVGHGRGPCVPVVGQREMLRVDRRALRGHRSDRCVERLGSAILRVYRVRV